MKVHLQPQNILKAVLIGVYGVPQGSHNGQWYQKVFIS